MLGRGPSASPWEHVGRGRGIRSPGTRSPILGGVRPHAAGEAWASLPGTVGDASPSAYGAAAASRDPAIFPAGSPANGSRTEALLRVEVLEHLVAEQAAQIDHIGSMCRSMHVEHNNLRADHGALWEEHMALCDCLRAVGALAKEEPQARRQIRRSVVLLREVLEVPELVFAVGLALGVASAKLLPTVSHIHGTGMRQALPVFIARMPPAIHVFGGHTMLGRPLATAERFNPRSERWEILPPMRTARFSSACASMDGKLYMVGGNGGQLALSTVECFDPTVGRWEFVPPMPTARQRCAAAGVGGKLFVVGGEDKQPLKIVEQYDPVNHSWELVSDMLMERTGCAAGALMGRLYVVGGADIVGHASASAECFDPCLGDWTQLPYMTTEREFCAAAVVNARLYVLGGRLSLWGTLATVECYDPNTGQWASHPDMPEERSRCAATAAAGQIYVVGGSDSRYEALSATARFDFGLGMWQTLPPAPTARVSCSVGVAWC